MTQAEKLLARLLSLEQTPGLHEIVVYITADKTIGFWIVEKLDKKIEGEPKPVQNVV